MKYIGVIQHINVKHSVIRKIYGNYVNHHCPLSFRKAGICEICFPLAPISMFKSLIAAPSFLPAYFRASPDFLADELQNQGGGPARRRRSGG